MIKHLQEARIWVSMYLMPLNISVKLTSKMRLTDHSKCPRRMWGKKGKKWVQGIEFPAQTLDNLFECHYPYIEKEAFISCSCNAKVAK
jgi:hypothetical protein